MTEKLEVIIEKWLDDFEYSEHPDGNRSCERCIEDLVERIQAWAKKNALTYGGCLCKGCPHGEECVPLSKFGTTKLVDIGSRLVVKKTHCGSCMQDVEVKE